MNEEHTDHSLHEKPAVPVDNNSVEPEPNTSALLKETENMEVHHHAHHGAHKNWKSYIWEFLMLFLAVFCGFLAEYQLEHVIENQREKKYMVALWKEGRMDIDEYDSLLQRIYYIDPIADSLFYNVKQAEKYHFNLQSKWNTPFNHVKVSYFPSLAAIQQLEYSGNLRLVKNEDLLQQIIMYKTFVEGSLKTSGTNVQECLKQSYKLENVLCDLTAFNASLSNYIVKSKGGTAMQEETFEMPLLVKDPEKLNELASSFADFRGYLNGYIISIKEAKQKALLLNRKIKEQYHIEE